jgi:hypothetical protein
MANRMSRDFEISAYDGPMEGSRRLVSVRGIGSESLSTFSGGGRNSTWLSGLGKLQESERKERMGQASRLKNLTKSLTMFYTKHNPDYLDRVDGLAR